jgi:thiol-disulfide isomerase/thioredoxin
MLATQRLGVLMAAVTLGVGTGLAQSPATIIKEVRTAVRCTSWPCVPNPDLSEGEALLKQHRAAHGTTSEALEALSWLGRAALAGRQLDKASAFAAETSTLAAAALKTRSLADDPHLEVALGAAIEVQAQVRAARGQRSDAVYFLRRELERYRDTPLHRRIQKNLHLLSLEGQPAPPLESGEALGRPLPSLDRLRGKVVLLFFWAHWCPDCKAQAPVLASLLDRYGDDGLDEETRYIAGVVDASYPFLRDAYVPVSAENHTQYGVSTTPTLALIDRRGVVRLYHPGNMTEEELSGAIRPLLAARPSREAR